MSVLRMQGVHALAQDLGTDVNTATREKDAFMRSLPGVRAWQACHHDDVARSATCIALLVCRQQRNRRRNNSRTSGFRKCHSHGMRVTNTDSGGATSAGQAEGRVQEDAEGDHDGRPSALVQAHR